MPVKFLCDHCNQVLKVSTSKVGVRARCPKCDAKIKIPSVEEGAAAVALVRAEREELAEDEDPFSEFTVYDVDTEVVYEFDSEKPERKGNGGRQVDHGKIAVSRAIVYSVGVVQIVIAIVFFVFGIIVGMDLGSGSGAGTTLSAPCIVSGTVEYLDGNDQPTPDRGAVVILLPTEGKPDLERKADPDGLHPEADLPADENRGLWAIRELGGEYARTNQNGQFNLQVSNQQAYYVLYISKSMFRGEDDELSSPLRSSIGSYFSDVNMLLGQNQFRWEQLTIRNSTKKNVGNIVFQ